MPIEIEVKMRLSDRKSLEATLAQVGGQRGPLIEQSNWIFDTAQHDLRRAGQGLRVRSETHIAQYDPVVTIAHKGPKMPGPIKKRQETELQVDSVDHAVQLLEALGFVCILQFEKRRLRWQLDDCLVEIDTIAQLGDFVEIEGPSEHSVMAVRRKLVLSNETLIQQSYAGLIQTHLEEHGIKTPSLLFKSS